MIKSTVCSLVLMLAGMSLAACTTSRQPVSSQDGLPLVFHDDFSDGDMEEWEPTDPAAWEVVERSGDQMMALTQPSEYEPPVRSPHNYALIKDLWVSDFILEARVKSTSEQYGHRDICVFYGWQDPSHFYYTHLAPAPDPHAHSVFLVNDEPRVSIVDERSDGVDWGDEFHTVRIVRDAEAGTIEVYFDDMSEPIMRAEDTHFASGRLGLGTFDDTGLYDDVKVWGRRVENPGSADAGS